MTAFRSRWDDWVPKESTPRTDKTDKSPSVSFVSGTTGRFDETEGASVSSVSSSPRPFADDFDPSDPETGDSPSIEGSQKTPTSRTDKTDRSLPQAFKLTPDGSLLRRAHLAVVPDLSDPEDIRVWLDERAAMREVGSSTTRVDADKLAFDELLWIWHAANPVTLDPGQCAACGIAFEPPVMSLPDGAQVCDQPDHGCLIAYGNGRRMEAAKALEGIAIAPPMWWEL